MTEVRLTKRIEFAAAHRYHRDEWDAARNRAVFGACWNAPGHGHNYLLEVTVVGAVDEATGMVVNLYDLKSVLKQVLEEFDHKHLNLDTPYFARTIPTSENIARVFWGRLMKHPEIGRLEKIRLYEDENLSAEIAGPGAEATVTRRYRFSAGHRLYDERLAPEANIDRFGPCGGPAHHGHNYLLSVSVQGPVDGQTGMVVNLTALDEAVRASVLARVDRRDLDQDRELAGRATGERLARFIWECLVKALPAGRLARIGLEETPDAYFEYAG